MNATALAQSEFDNCLPPPVSESPLELAKSEWLYNATEQLVRYGRDVKFQRRMCSPQGVRAEEFALAVDEYANKRLADCEVHTSALGWLLITTAYGKGDYEAVIELLGRSEHPFGKLGEIAESLLAPLADDALIAQAEDDEL